METKDLTKVFYEDNQVAIRTTAINDEVWFVAKDVAIALNIAWRGDETLNLIPADWKGVRKFRTPYGSYRGGGLQELKVINEAAVYKLAFRSNKPEADKFVNWIAEEVLPSIRKTGSYSVNKDEHPRLPLPKYRKGFAEWKKALTPYINRNDLMEVAELNERTYEHLRKVWGGFSVSMPMCVAIQQQAKSNRKNGITYPEPPGYVQLTFDFGSEDVNEKGIQL